MSQQKSPNPKPPPLSEPHASQPLPYTASPYRLALADFLLWIRITFVLPPAGVPSIVLPIGPFRSGTLDELYPTYANLQTLLLQLFFTLAQAVFLLTLPLFAFVITPYPPLFLAYILLYILANTYLSNILLNPSSREIHSSTSLTPADSHLTEKWLFVNGVACSTHWLRSAVDRLALTFRRPVHGIHNPTRGVLFDLLECVVERTFGYATPSTRTVYARLLDAVSDPKNTRVVVVLHSQGAIEGGLALDWLFASVDAVQLRRLEVYTFGSAANHFNDPVRVGRDGAGDRVDLPGPLSGDRPGGTASAGRVLGHIEHYANAHDYVAQFGILNYRPLPQGNPGGVLYDPITQRDVENRYAGRLFVRNASGHQFNGNYLDNFFEMDSSLDRVLDGNAYMDSVVNRAILDEYDVVVVKQGQRQEGVGDEENVIRVKDVSRLWMYRDGMSPEN